MNSRVSIFWNNNSCSLHDFAQYQVIQKNAANGSSNENLFVDTMELENELQELNMGIDLKNNEIQEGQKIIIPLEYSVEEMVASLDEKTSNLNILTESVTTKQEALSVANSDVESALSAMNDAMDKSLYVSVTYTSGDHTTITGVRNEINPKVQDEREKAKANYQRALLKQVAAQNELNNAQDELNAKKDELKSLKTDYEANKSKLDSENNKLEVNKTDLSELETKIAETETAIDNAKAAMTKTDELNAEAENNKEVAETLGFGGILNLNCIDIINNIPEVNDADVLHELAEERRASDDSSDNENDEGESEQSSGLEQSSEFEQSSELIETNEIQSSESQPEEKSTPSEQSKEVPENSGDAPEDDLGWRQNCIDNVENVDKFDELMEKKFGDGQIPSESDMQNIEDAYNAKHGEGAFEKYMLEKGYGKPQQ